MQLYPKKKKNSTNKKNLFIILYLSIEIFLTCAIFFSFFFLNFLFRDKNQVMNETISS